MYCTTCGRELSGTMRYCPYCGAPTQPTAQEPAPDAPDAAGSRGAADAPVAAPRRRRWPVVVALVALVAVLVGGGWWLWSSAALGASSGAVGDADESGDVADGSSGDADESDAATADDEASADDETTDDETTAESSDADGYAADSVAAQTATAVYELFVAEFGDASLSDGYDSVSAGSATDTGWYVEVDIDEDGSIHSVYVAAVWFDAADVEGGFAYANEVVAQVLALLVQAGFLGAWDYADEAAFDEELVAEAVEFAASATEEEDHIVFESSYDDGSIAWQWFYAYPDSGYNFMSYYLWGF